VLLRTCPRTGLTRRLLKRCSRLLSVVEACLGDCVAWAMGAGIGLLCRLSSV